MLFAPDGSMFAFAMPIHEPWLPFLSQCALQWQPNNHPRIAPNMPGGGGRKEFADFPLSQRTDLARKRRRLADDGPWRHPTRGPHR